MSTKINLDRSVPLEITYPIGVSETLTIIFNDEVTITDVYQIVICDNSGAVVDTVTEADAEFTKVDNKLVWDINYEIGGVLTTTSYSFEYQNTTQDYVTHNGTINVTKRK